MLSKKWNSCTIGGDITCSKWMFFILRIKTASLQIVNIAVIIIFTPLGFECLKSSNFANSLLNWSPTVISDNVHRRDSLLITKEPVSCHLKTWLIGPPPGDIVPSGSLAYIHATSLEGHCSQPTIIAILIHYGPLTWVRQRKEIINIWWNFLFLLVTTTSLLILQVYNLQVIFMLKLYCRLISAWLDGSRFYYCVK